MPSSSAKTEPTWQIALLAIELKFHSRLHTAGPRSMTRQGEQNQWDGAGMSQEDFMIKDECITLDENDGVTGHANK